MKKILLTLAICTLISIGSNAQINLFSGSDNVLAESWDAAGVLPNSFMLLDVVSSQNACGTGDEIKIDYNSKAVTPGTPPTGGYWAGNGAYNINGWGFNQQDFSSFTYLEFKVKYVGSNPENTLILTLRDTGTVANNIVDGIAGNSITVLGSEASSCISKLIPLTDITGSTGMNLATVGQIEIAIGGFAWNSDINLEGSGTGTFYIDEIKVVNSATASVLASHLTESFTVSPNPSNGIFAISGSSQVSGVVVSDALGNIVLKSNSNQVDLSNQPEGLYFLTITAANNTTIVKKVSKR